MCDSCFLPQMKLINEAYKLHRIWAPLPVKPHFPPYPHVFFSWHMGLFPVPVTHYAPSFFVENSSFMVSWRTTAQCLPPQGSFPFLPISHPVVISYHSIMFFTLQFQFFIGLCFMCLSLYSTILRALQRHRQSWVCLPIWLPYLRTCFWVGSQ